MKIGPPESPEWREFLDDILKVGNPVAAPQRRLTWRELQEQVLQRLAQRGRKRKLQANLPAAYVNDRDAYVRLPDRRGESLRVIGCGDVSALQHEIKAATRSAVRAPLVVVDFLSELCAPCGRLKPEIHQLSQEMPEVVFLEEALRAGSTAGPEVDVDMNSEAADLYQVTSLPTLVFIKNQKVLGRYEGSDVDELTLKLLEYK